MNLEAYTPEYHILGPVKIKEIIISSGCIQLECIPELHSFLPNMSVPQDRELSINISKELLFEMIEGQRNLFTIELEEEEEGISNLELENLIYQDFCKDIEDGLQLEENAPGVIEMQEQYPMFSQISNFCLLIGYRPMGKCEDPFDLEYYKELNFNHNSFIVDKVIWHTLIGMYRPFDGKELIIESHRDDNILALLELYLVLKNNGYNEDDALKMSCLQHEWFLILAKELAKDSEYYEDLLQLGLN